MDFVDLLLMVCVVLLKWMLGIMLNVCGGVYGEYLCFKGGGKRYGKFGEKNDDNGLFVCCF